MKWIGPLALVTAFSGCATFQTSQTKIFPDSDSTRRVGKFVWQDLVTHDVAAAKGFYGDLFGWQFQETGDDGYLVATLAGRPVAGLIQVAAEQGRAPQDRWIGSLSVADVDSATELTRTLGGEVIEPPDSVAGRGRVAVVRDPQGGVVALIHAEGGDPPDHSTVSGSWLWTELWSDSLPESVAFYRDLVGYQEASETQPTGTYHVLSRDGTPRAGVVAANALPGVETNWVPYVLVDDVKETVTRATQLGGRALLGPAAKLGGGDVAILLDSTGAVFGVQQENPGKQVGHD